MPTPKYLRRNLYGTHILSTILQALNIPEHPEHANARAVIDALIRKGRPHAAIGEFNRRFGMQSIQLRLRYWKGDVSADIPPTQLRFALWQLLLLLRDSPNRFRRCPECDTYFFDRSKNASAQRCGKKCSSRATSRDYRAAGKERDRRRKHPRDISA